MYKILIIEDDYVIANAIRTQLSMWDMDARCIDDFRDVISETISYDPHLILMDIGLPAFNGFHWCKEIRKFSQVPIIFISSASDNMNIVMAMNMGADDFIAKPFDQSVLVSKIQALLRRTYDFASPATMLQHRGAVLNMSTNTLIVNDAVVELSKNEYRILLLLMRNKGKIVSREKLMDDLWATDSFIDDNTLTVNIGRLRKKLEAAGLDDFIKTKFGVGYYIE